MRLDNANLSWWASVASGEPMPISGLPAALLWAGNPASRYDHAVQEIEVALIVVSVLGLIVAVAAQNRTRLARRPLVVGALLGITPGILGAIVVLIPRMDLVPDAAEPYIWTIIGLLVSGAVVFVLSRAIVRG